MKHLLLLFFIVTNLNAQSTLDFNKRFVESEDKWVAFQKNEEDSYAYGFIYVDEDAGLTLNYEGTFTITQNGEFIPTKFNNSSMKVRLEPNDVLVAFIPEDKFNNLKIEAVPDWLKYYKENENSIERLYKWGFMYNGWNECAKALTFLEKAEKINPKYPQLAVELSFSYNCLKQYSKAENILEKEVKSNSKDAYVSKEYIYTLTKSNNIDKAIKHYKIAAKTVEDRQYNAENCYNILQYFYLKKDKENFNIWHKELSKLEISNEMIKQYANSMNEELNK